MYLIPLAILCVGLWVIAIWMLLDELLGWTDYGDF